MHMRENNIWEYVVNNKKKIIIGVAIFIALFILGIFVAMVATGKYDAGRAATPVVGDNVQSTETAPADDATVQDTNADTLNVNSNLAGTDPDLQQTEEESRDTLCVMIDPGHGGVDMGSSRDKILEKDINLQIALLLRDKLEDMGYEVIMTREDDTFVALEDRSAKANEAQIDIFVSIHQNSFEEDYVHGIETWYSGVVSNEYVNRSGALGDDSRRLAQLLHKDLLQATDGHDRSVREGQLWVTYATNAPSCLIECGFVSNKEECEKLISEEYQEQIVEGLAEGIDRYFHPKKMYLTIEAGASAENTNAILDILKDRNVKTLFLIDGENATKHPEVVRRIVEEGHNIGLVCKRSISNDISESMERTLSDFETAYNAVYQATGVKVKLFRFSENVLGTENPELNQSIKEAISARGFIYYNKITESDSKFVVFTGGSAYSISSSLDDLFARYPEYKAGALQ